MLFAQAVQTLISLLHDLLLDLGFRGQARILDICKSVSKLDKLGLQVLARLFGVCSSLRGTPQGVLLDVHLLLDGDLSLVQCGVLLLQLRKIMLCKHLYIVPGLPLTTEISLRLEQLTLKVLGLLLEQFPTLSSLSIFGHLGLEKLLDVLGLFFELKFAGFHGIHFRLQLAKTLLHAVVTSGKRAPFIHHVAFLFLVLLNIVA